MSGTHDILAAERAAAAANKQSNQGIWQGKAEAPVNTDTIIDKDPSSGLDTGRTSARDTLSGATSSAGTLGHHGSSQELHRDGSQGHTAKRDIQMPYRGSESDDVEM